ncbi:MAG: response regulator transcription factor [Sedimentisphaerales bacterium]|nr:response regulator transcription factor [Sedimentisphaerales bacterium]
MSLTNLTVMLVDDHRIVRDGLRALIGKVEGMSVCGEAENGREAIELSRQLHADVILMDVTVPDINGIEATGRIMKELPETKIIALSTHSDPHVAIEMFKAGARGYVPKHCGFEEVVRAIREVMEGKVYLSPQIAGAVISDYMQHVQHVPVTTTAFETLAPRQREVLQMIAEGNSTKKIAGTLHISIKTVDWHKHDIKHKLHIDTLAGLVKYAIRENLTSVEHV